MSPGAGETATSRSPTRIVEGRRKDTSPETPAARHARFIDEALRLTCEALTPMIARRVSPAVAREARDPQVLARVLLDSWDVIVLDSPSKPSRSLVHRLRDVRNQWAHYQPFGAPDVVVAIAYLKELVSALAGDAAAAKLTALLRRAGAELGI